MAFDLNSFRAQLDIVRRSTSPQLTHVHNLFASCEALVGEVESMRREVEGAWADADALALREYASSAMRSIVRAIGVTDCKDDTIGLVLSCTAGLPVSRTGLETSIPAPTLETDEQKQQMQAAHETALAKVTKLSYELAENMLAQDRKRRGKEP